MNHRAESRDISGNFKRTPSAKFENRNSIPTTREYLDLDGTSDWVKVCFIQSQTLHGEGYQYGISAVVPQTSFRGETSSGFTKCRMLSQATCVEHVPLGWQEKRITDKPRRPLGFSCLSLFLRGKPSPLGTTLYTGKLFFLPQDQPLVR